MPPELVETRTHYTPRTGTKVVFLIGLVIIIAAIYAAVMPLSVQASNGTTFGCGSAVKPNNSDFGKNYCKDADRGGQYRAAAVAASGLGVIGVGAFLFGFDTTTRTRKARPGFDDGYDDDEDDTPTPRRRPRNTRDGVDDVDVSPKLRADADPSPRRRPMAGRSTPRNIERERDSADDDSRELDDLDHEDLGHNEVEDDSSRDRSGSIVRRPSSNRTAQRGRRRVDADDDPDADGDLAADDDVDGPRKRR